MSPFELFSETPRPYLDLDVLKEKFHKLSAPLHPDRVHHLSEQEKGGMTQKFSELNRAHQILKEPKERLEQLFQIITDSSVPRIQNVPSPLMEMSFEIGKFCKEADDFLISEPPGVSPLLHANYLQHKKKCLNRLETMEIQISDFERKAMDELKNFDQAWMSQQEKLPFVDQLEHLISLFSYLSRWKKQIAERSVRFKIL